ncbi:MAG: penicillin acylase family protein [Phycisphaerales bacterium]|jgi:acyl-homoserine-lactone acylase|nr:penicillin acylase family protein [Phycisphaerales bacterium]
MRRLSFASLTLISSFIVSQAAAQPEGQHPAPGATAPSEAATASVLRARELAAQVTITRDEFGIPHAHGVTDAAAVFGAMFARAEDEYSRIEQAHALSIGRAAQMLGAEALSWDRIVLSYEVPELARRQNDEAPPEVRALTQAAADALNYYVSLHPAGSSGVIETWEPWMLVAREYGFALYQAQSEAQRVYAAVVSKQPNLTPNPPAAPDGSNAWAIAGSRTASGRAMLYANPHIPLDEAYELHLSSDAGLNISGSVMYGGGILPSIGFNERLGWSLTVNYPDIADTYAIKLGVDGDELAYRFGNEIRHAIVWKVKLGVKTAAGIEPQEISLAKAHNAPILFQASGVSYAIRVGGMENSRAVEQWYRMARATNLGEWKAAVSLFGLAFHNLVYADADGNIGYIYNAAFPRRDPARDYSGVLDGSDPANEWQGLHTLGEIPQVWNPVCGYVMNCNSSPLSAAAEGQNPDRASFPAYMIGHDLTDGRVAMSHDLLSNANGWTLADLERAAFDTRVYSLDSLRKPLLAEFDKLVAADPARVERVAPAVEAIRAWDGRITLDSSAASLFLIWAEKLFTPAWSSRRAPGDLSAALAEVMGEYERDFGDWRVAWGEINRHQRFDTSAGLGVSDSRESFPIAGGHGSLGVSFCYLARSNGTKRRYGYHGSSYVAAVEFADAPAARTIVPFGASRHPDSPHYADQAPIYASGHLKPAHFSAADVAHAKRRAYHPGE